MFWCCAQIVPFRERLALHCLDLNGFEVYCPRLREQRRVRGRKIITTPPLFPSYANAVRCGSSCAHAQNDMACPQRGLR